MDSRAGGNDDSSVGDVIPALAGIHVWSPYPFTEKSVIPARTGIH